MLRSKLGQGLAVSAVSALAITGMTVLATPSYALDGADVRLISQQDGLASVRRDAGFPGGTTITLTAEQLDPAATVFFQYNVDATAPDDSPTWTTIISSTAVVGTYATNEWDPAPELIGTHVALRAVARVSGTDGPDTATYSTRHDVLLTGPADDTQAVSLGQGGGPGSGYGAFFAQPYADSGRTQQLMAVQGTTSATGGTVELSAWNPTAGEFQGQVDAAVGFGFLKVSPSMGGDYIPGGTFTEVLDIAAYDLGDGDVLPVRAVRDSDTVVPMSLRAQAIAGIAHYQGAAGPETTPVTLRVTDGSSTPVVGAEVRRLSDGHLVGYTGRGGEVDIAQPDSTTERYYANTTDTDAFEDGTDVVTDDVTTAAYEPVPTSTEVVLADGNVFDDREYADGDITLQVVDAAGLDYTAEPQEVSYALYPSGAERPGMTTATTDEHGRVVVPFDPSDPDGEWTLAYTAPSGNGGDEQDPSTFVAGDAVLDLAPVHGTATSGGTITYDGHLSVEGRPLPGRELDLAYARGTEQAPGTAADAALVLGDHLASEGSTTTDGDGAFVVTVADLAEAGGPAETGGVLSVTARGPGDVATATADFTATPVDPTPTETPTPTPTLPQTPIPSPEPGREHVTLRLTGADRGAHTDLLRVDAGAAAAGEKVRVHVLTTFGWRRLRTVELDERGRATVTLRDRNGMRATRYRVRLAPDPRRFATTSTTLRLR